VLLHHLPRLPGEALEGQGRGREGTLHALLANAPDEGPVGVRPTFKKLADLYLDFTQQTKSERTYAHQKYFLQLFCDHVKTKRAADLKPGDVTAWLLKHSEQWGHNTQVTARGLVVACLNWAVAEGYLPYSPLARMKVGQMHTKEWISPRRSGRGCWRR
jgi:hypothetical protein